MSEAPVNPDGKEVWNNESMHTVNPHKMPDGRWIALVDGIGNGKTVK